MKNYVYSAIGTSKHVVYVYIHTFEYVLSFVLFIFYEVHKKKLIVNYFQNLFELLSVLQRLMFRNVYYLPPTMSYSSLNRAYR